jgi:hypothetical protein
MAQVQRRIVHKQFNSPIALYSDTNVKETLDRELKQLGNGAIGIDFDDPSTTRPGSLAKSAVLAALEEEERIKAGSKPGLKRVAWPPPAESALFASEPVDYHQEPPQQTQPQYQAISQQQQSQPVQNQQAHIVSQTSTPQYQPIYDPPQPQQQCYQQPLQQHHQQPFMGNALRKEAPISQKPAPVYQSQPVAASFQGGTHHRGDLKWPPNEYKMQAEVENEQRRKLALGPAFRPKRVNKDYTGFFAQNALSNTYPGYRVPPGTLHVGNGEFL